MCAGHLSIHQRLSGHYPLDMGVSVDPWWYRFRVASVEEAQGLSLLSILLFSFYCGYKSARTVSHWSTKELGACLYLEALDY